MAGRSTNIYFPEKTYNELRQIVGSRISRFVNEAVEEKIQREEQQKEGEFQKKLIADRSEEHTSELQSHVNLVCRLLLEKKKKRRKTYYHHIRNSRVS